jgi:hypothetical protein
MEQRQRHIDWCSALEGMMLRSVHISTISATLRRKESQNIRLKLYENCEGLQRAAAPSSDGHPHTCAAAASASNGSGRGAENEGGEERYRRRSDTVNPTF